ncbi:F420-dependent oxidoreductase-like protein [Microbacterium terrae]|uniref:Pyrimidine monooxygenase RutA n=1 Tax=Microbacterium terrae TaxID=69369 RepID=A0A0M2GUS5_9MICO|nr:LLM class F420-dependent oxidoreductase [Microbacterium terrae]KJL37421.1 Pyrimidine monooxygenase RutA [Microbacterium terrae]MBP1076249.1 F420-dependent oxidoreductase-like protein [Microbacterium terrae]GLJ97072.1 LLM class F420-dependent oxidoreductase [Microbacterium terrae]
MEYCVFTEPHLGGTYGDQLAYAQVAERTGFTGYFRSDHYLSGMGDGLPGPTDAWTTLAGLARETSRIRLGTLVSPVTFRHPAVLAIQVAQVDEMSGGRVELGLGAGWFEREHQAYGIPFPAKRFDHLEEQLEIVTGLWSTPVGGSYSFTGANYRLDDAPALPKPVQSPVPVIIGGGGPRRTPDLVARFATEYNVGFPEDHQIQERIDNLHRACERIGRDPATVRLSLAMSTFAGGDDAEVARRAARIGKSLDEVRDGTNIVGGPDEIGERVAHYRSFGIERVYFQLLDLQDADHVDYLGIEVLPHLPR